MKAAVFISVRNKARRLPGKVLHPIRGRSVIEHIIDRVSQAKRADLVVLTTSPHPDDQILVEVAKKNGIEAFCGDPDDKLVRYLDAARAFGVDFAVIVDGDDVFCDPICIDRIIDEHATRGGDYIIVDHLPVGVTGFGISISGLAKVVEWKKGNDTEVWGMLFADDPRLVSRFLPAPERWAHPEWRMTLDYPDDLAFFERIFDELADKGTLFSFDDIADLLVKKPEIAAINRDAQAQYGASIAATIERQNRVAAETQATKES